MQVSRSAYYSWRAGRYGVREQRDLTLLTHMQSIHRESRQSYGSPRLYHALKKEGVTCGRNRVARLMRQHGIEAKKKRRYRITTTSKHTMPVADNVLDREFSAKAPNERWVSDITYLWTSEGWLYLGVVLDLFSRRVVGWSMQSTLETSVASDALTMALHTRRPAPGLIHHSDRGSQYASRRYQDQLQSHGMECSMSRKGNCWDNAVAESFFSTLKTELTRDQRFLTHDQAKLAVFEYIEVWYNRKRQHSTVGFLSPVQCEQQFEDQRKASKHP